MNCGQLTGHYINEQFRGDGGMGRRNFLPLLARSDASNPVLKTQLCQDLSSFGNLHLLATSPVRQVFFLFNSAQTPPVEGAERQAPQLLNPQSHQSAPAGDCQPVLTPSHSSGAGQTIQSKQVADSQRPTPLAASVPAPVQPHRKATFEPNFTRHTASHSPAAPLTKLAILIACVATLLYHVR